MRSGQSTSLSPRRSGSRLLPSSLIPAGAATRQASRKVGKRSMCAASRSTMRPAGNWPGQRMIARHADSALVDRPLYSPQAGIEADLGRAVVRQEDDDRVLGETMRFECRQEPADVRIDVGHHRIDAGDVIGRVERVGGERVPEAGDRRRQRDPPSDRPPARPRGPGAECAGS